MEIQDKVKAIRKQLEKSQTTFSEELDIDYTTLSRIERGIFKPNYKFMENLKKVCKKYNINMEDNNSLWSVEIVYSDDLYADIVKVIDSSYSIANKTINYLLIKRNH